MKTGGRSFIIWRSSNGFTLIEALIAISIFAIGFMAITPLVFSTTRNNTTGNIITQATMLARKKMEALKSEDITNLIPGEYVDPKNPIDARGETGGIFKRTWKIEELADSTTARRIQVNVNWDRLGQKRSVVLRTITRGNGT